LKLSDRVACGFHALVNGLKKTSLLWIHRFGFLGANIEEVAVEESRFIF
jgi:hypothetical protein